MIGKRPGGLAAILNGADGCLLPLVWLIAGFLIMPSASCLAFILVTRDGLRAAFTGDFTQRAFYILAGLVLVVTITAGVATVAAARALARRPQQLVPAAPTIHMRVEGGQGLLPQNTQLAKPPALAPPPLGRVPFVSGSQSGGSIGWRPPA